MIEQILYYFHYAFLLMFGIAVSAAFSGISVTKPNVIRLMILATVCGSLQLAVYGICGEATVWQVYPLITHFPTVLALRFLFGRRLSNAVSATASAYLCCQPARWFGIALNSLTGSSLAELLIRILVLLVTLAVILRWFTSKVSRIYSRSHSGSWVFGIILVVYYLFDYAVSIYSSLWADTHQLAVEFLPFFLCIGHLIFCKVYYQEYELKNEAERKEHILRITVEQQTNELEMIRRSENEIRRLRHDLRLFLNSLSSCIEQSDKETAQKLITAFSDQTEASSIQRYCANDTLNYVLSDYAAQCREQGIRFHSVIELSELSVDEILFSTILANALENAINAQKGLPESRRIIRLLLKNSGGKLLLCVKNSFHEPPVFRDGIPVTSRKGHGYGVQSIQYLTSKLGGHCQFSLEEESFVLHVII